MVFKAPSPLYLGPVAHSSGTNNKPITRIVLHGTVSACVRGGARATAEYFRSQRAGGSAHYVTDPGEVVQTAYDSVVCWHAPPNGNSVGIEMCDPVGDANGRPLPLSRWNDENHRAMLKLTARLVAELCLAYGIPAVFLTPADLRAGKKGICEHADVSKAFGQSTHWDLGQFPRRAFLRMVKAETEAITASNSNVKLPVKTAPTRVDQARDLLRAAAQRTKHKARRTRIQSCIDQLPEH